MMCSSSSKLQKEIWTHYYMAWLCQVDDAERDHPPTSPLALPVLSKAATDAAASAH